MRFFAKSVLALAVLAAAPAFAEQQPSARVGRVSYISGTLAFYGPGDADWSAAKVNFPVGAGGWFATDPQSRAELGIGAETIDMAGDTQLGITDLHDGVMQIGLTQGRLDLNLRRLGGDETAEIDIPRGGVWLLQPGIYDIDSGTADQPARITVFEGSARFVGGGVDMAIKAGDAVVLNGTDVASAKVERAVADDFVKWCRSHDYQEHKLAAPYHVSPAVTGFEELDAYGGWATVPQYGAVWYPNSVPADWAPYRDGQWVWVEPWGWTWVDAEPWGFAPFHYGRWAYIDNRWGWVPGNFVPRPVYAPALVAFIEDVGVAAPPDAGAPVGWFPLAPGEIYWPSYTRDPAYIANVNIANVSAARIIEVTRIAQTRRSAGPPPLVTNQQFANRRAATVVPANVFAGSARVASAVLSASPQAVQRAHLSLRPPPLTPTVARSASAPPLPQRQAAQPPLPAAAHPAGPPDFRALAPAPSGPHGRLQTAQQPGQAGPGAPAIGHAPTPPNFSHLAPAGSHGQPPAAQALAQPAPGRAMPGHPPGPPNFVHLAPATGTERVPATPPPAQAARSEPAHPAAPQAAPQETQRAAERAAQQRAAAQAAAQHQAQQRAAAAQAASQQRAAAQAATQHQVQQRAAAAQAASQQRAAAQAATQHQAQQRAAAAQAAAQQRAAAQAAAQHQAQQRAAAAQAAAQQRAVAQHAPPPQQQAHGNCGHEGQQGCPR
jgi:hypothetical protein